MKYIRINEKKWATIVLLEKIKDMYSFEDTHNGEEWGEKESYSINEFIILNGKNFKISHDVFVETLTYLETKKLIKLLDHMSMSINEIIKDPLDYATEERTINSSFSEKDLDDDDIFEYEIAIKNFPQVKKRIKELNSLKITIDQLIKNNLSLEDKDIKSDLKNKIVPLEFEIKNFVWEDIILKFDNAFDIRIYIKNEFMGTYSHERLGFFKANTNDKKEDVQWIFFKKMSISNGIFDFNKHLNFGTSAIEQKNAIKEKHRVIISNLSKHLKKLFTLKERPFDCENEKYTAKFKLEPEPLLRGKGEVFIKQTPNKFL